MGYSVMLLGISWGTPWELEEEVENALGTW
jgi:hypothetical protein